MTHIDFMGLGLNFNCSMMGERRWYRLPVEVNARCEGAEEPKAKGSTPTLPPSHLAFSLIFLRGSRW